MTRSISSSMTLRLSLSLACLYAVFLLYNSGRSNVVHSRSRLAQAVLVVEDEGLPTTGSTADSSPPPEQQQQLKIPTPIFVLSLPKSATTSIWKYFGCGLGPGHSVHHYTKIQRRDDNTTQLVKIGKCLHDNLHKKKRPILQDCGDYDVWSDMGVLAPGLCFYPSLNHDGALEALAQDYPHGTLLQIVRDTQAWLNSTLEYNDLWDRWMAKCDGFPPPGSHRSVLAEFYEQHTRTIRQFARDHPSMTYMELPLNADTGRLLEERTGIDASQCWVHTNNHKHLAVYKKKKKSQQQ